MDKNEFSMCRAADHMPGRWADRFAYILKGVSEVSTALIWRFPERGWCLWISISAPAFCLFTGCESPAENEMAKRTLSAKVAILESELQEDTVHVTGRLVNHNNVRLAVVRETLEKPIQVLVWKNGERIEEPQALVSLWDKVKRNDVRILEPGEGCQFSVQFPVEVMQHDGKASGLSISFADWWQVNVQPDDEVAVQFRITSSDSYSIVQNSKRKLGEEGALIDGVIVPVFDGAMTNRLKLELATP